MVGVSLGWYAPWLGPHTYRWSAYWRVHSEIVQPGLGQRLSNTAFGGSWNSHIPSSWEVQSLGHVFLSTQRSQCSSCCPVVCQLMSSYLCLLTLNHLLLNNVMVPNTVPPPFLSFILWDGLCECYTLFFSQRS